MDNDHLFRDYRMGYHGGGGARPVERPSDGFSQKSGETMANSPARMEVDTDK